jgi:hypothetical protein
MNNESHSVEKNIEKTDLRIDGDSTIGGTLLCGDIQSEGCTNHGNNAGREPGCHVGLLSIGKQSG